MKHAKTHAYNAHRRRRRRISNSEMFSRVFIARSLLKKNEIIIIKIIQKNNKKKERERERKICNEKYGTVWESVFTDSANSRVVIFPTTLAQEPAAHTTLPTIKTIYNCIQSLSKRIIKCKKS